MAQMQATRPYAATERANQLTKLTYALGSLISVGLIVGMGVWGYKLLVRDVSGVPVVRAAEGPMRVLPENPGGRQALNQGLAVNDVAAIGTAAEPAETLILAPEPLDLNFELGPETAAAPDAAVDDETAAILALAQSIADGVEPLEPVRAEAPKVTGGLGKSLRPQMRPTTFAGAQAVSAVAAAGPGEIDPTAIPVGTRLAQLGAFKSEEIARQEWTRLEGKFEAYLAGKDRVIQRATSGGRTFYRLRAMGFEDLADARRFCSALVAERAECIPVVTR